VLGAFDGILVAIESQYRDTAPALRSALWWSIPSSPWIQRNAYK